MAVDLMYRISVSDSGAFCRDGYSTASKTQCVPKNSICGTVIFFRCAPSFRPCDMIWQDAAIQYNKIQYKLDVVVVASALDYM